ncbi:MAG: ParA family protein [Phycisphaerae bacterium]|nr:ParA family protein [Phycisphaerae bacterium]
MRSIAILNQKGGVGKTTSAVNIAAALARADRRVLLIDLDPQAHASMHLGYELNDGEASVYDVLVSGASALEALRQIDDRLMLMPSHLDLVAAELELSGKDERETILARAVQPLYDELDFCILDCPPSLGLLAINALAASREVLIPLQPHFLALQGLGKLLQTVSLVRGALSEHLRVSGILFTMFETGTRLAQEVTRDVQQFIRDSSPEDAWHWARVFETHIRRNIKLAECPSFGQTIFDYAPGSNGAEDYMALAGEILAMIEPPPLPLAMAIAQLGMPDGPPPLPPVAEALATSEPEADGTPPEPESTPPDSPEVMAS